MTTGRPGPREQRSAADLNPPIFNSIQLGFCGSERIWALKYGGAGLCRTLAVLFTLILRAGAVPKRWLIGAMRCVYKKNCPTVFTNYRGVVPTSHLGKLFERVLLCRLLGIAESDELQAVANPGIDTRSQIHLVYLRRLRSRVASAAV